MQVNEEVAMWIQALEDVFLFEDEDFLVSHVSIVIPQVSSIHLTNCVLYETNKGLLPCVHPRKLTWNLKITQN